MLAGVLALQNWLRRFTVSFAGETVHLQYLFDI